MPFRVALSGLNAAGQDLRITANNIANVNTTGFKRSRAEFGDLYAVSTFGVGTNAIASGMIPGVDPNCVNVVGNSSLAGARIALLDVHSLECMRRLSSRIDVIELNQDPNFEDRYLDALALG